MDNLFDLPAEYKELRSSARALAEKEIAPFAQGDELCADLDLRQ